MLLFIRTCRHRWHSVADFNTSHVTVYPCGLFFIGVIIDYFNTSHVTVYLSENGYIVVKVIFQYISCYCLSHRPGLPRTPDVISIHLMLLFIAGFCIFVHNFFLFPYISCYCLSSRKRPLSSL